MSFLQQNWPLLLFFGVMIYMHVFMHRGHGSHHHHARQPAPDGTTPPTDGTEPQGTEHGDHHRHGGC